MRQPNLLDTRTKNKIKRSNRDHDMLLGGKEDVSFSPFLRRRMNLIALRPDQCPFQAFIPVMAYWSLRSGIQSPVSNSRSSTSTRSFKASSRLLGGRPLRRSDWSSWISSVSRSMYLEDVSNGIEDLVGWVRTWRQTRSFVRW